MASHKTVIVTGASQGIGAAVAQAFLDRGSDVVATSLSFSEAGFAPSPHLALVDGDIGQAATAEQVAQTAIGTFGSIDHVVNNAGIFAVKPFTDDTIGEFRRFVSTNLEGFIVAGFNGRALTDDVMGVILTLATHTALGDGVAPDKHLLRPDFPYFGEPHT